MSELVDVQAALDELGLEMSDFEEFLVDLKEFVDETIPELKKAVEKEDGTQIRELAHSIKGAVANLRFKVAAEIAFTLEKIGQGVEEGSSDQVFAELTACLDASFQEVNRG